MKKPIVLKSNAIKKSSPVEITPNWTEILKGADFSNIINFTVFQTKKQQNNRNDMASQYSSSLSDNLHTYNLKNKIKSIKLYTLS